MENDEILRLWKSYDNRLNTALHFNRQAADNITLLKVQAMIRAMRPGKTALLLLGTVWVVGGVSLLCLLAAAGWQHISVYFFCSVAWQVLCTAAATGLYAYQLTMIAAIDVSDPLLVAQQKLARLQVATLWSLRILLLQLPAWSTFWWSDHFFAVSEAWQIGIAIITAVIFLLLAVLLFTGLHPANREKRWFRLFFGSWEWTPVFRAQSLLEEAKAVNEEDRS